MNIHEYKRLKNAKQFENLYDLIKGNCLKNDVKNYSDWEKISYKHFLQAKKELKEFVRDKKIEIDYTDKPIIKIGNFFTIELKIKD